MKKYTLNLLVLAIIVSFLGGCGTTITQYNLRNPGTQYSNDICEMLKYDKSPIVYSGAYADIHNFVLFPSTASGESGLLMMPFYPILLVIGVADLPFSLAADTLLLPYTIPYSNDLSIKCEKKYRAAEEDEKQRRNTLVPLYFKGRIVDSETGRPIEGAIVLAFSRISPLYTVTVNNVSEDISDSEGNVRINGMYPMHFQPPNIIVYKKGYFVQTSNSEPLYSFKWTNGYEFKMIKWNPSIPHKTHFESIYSYAVALKNAGNPLLLNSIQWEKDLER